MHYKIWLEYNPSKYFIFINRDYDSLWDKNKKRMAARKLSQKYRFLYIYIYIYFFLNNVIFIQYFF